MYHNFYEYLKSSRYLRIFCTLPLYYDKNKKPRPRFQTFPLLWFYGSSLLFNFAIMTFSATYIILDHHRDEKVTKFAVKLVKIAVTLNILFVITRNKEKFTTCMNLILHYEEHVQKWNITLSYRSLRIMLLSKKILILASSLLVNLSCFLGGNTPMYCVVSFVTYNITYLISSMVLTQFCGLILTIGQHLTIVNRHLIQISTKNSEDPVLKLREMMVYHFEICDFSGKINQAFSGQLLLIIVRTFVEFFNSLYSMVKEESHLLVMYDFFWSACAIFEFIFMLYACRKTTHTCSRTSRILNLLDTKNERVNLERNIFLLQLKHKNIKFSASSMFSIDNTMFLRLLSTTVAYLLIIVQLETTQNIK